MKRTRIIGTLWQARRTPSSITPTYKPVPQIHLAGLWLHRAGFHTGQPVTVEVEEGQITIRPIS